MWAGLPLHVWHQVLDELVSLEKEDILDVFLTVAQQNNQKLLQPKFRRYATVCKFFHQCLLPLLYDSVRVVDGEFQGFENLLANLSRSQDKGRLRRFEYEGEGGEEIFENDRTVKMMTRLGELAPNFIHIEWRGPFLFTTGSECQAVFTNVQTLDIQNYHSDAMFSLDGHSISQCIRHCKSMQTLRIEMVEDKLFIPPTVRSLALGVDYREFTSALGYRYDNHGKYLLETLRPVERLLELALAIPPFGPESVDYLVELFEKIGPDLRYLRLEEGENSLVSSGAKDEWTKITQAFAIELVAYCSNIRTLVLDGTFITWDRINELPLGLEVLWLQCELGSEKQGEEEFFKECLMRLRGMPNLVQLRVTCRSNSTLKDFIEAMFAHSPIVLHIDT